MTDKFITQIAFRTEHNNSIPLVLRPVLQQWNRVRAETGNNSIPLILSPYAEHWSELAEWEINLPLEARRRATRRHTVLTQLKVDVPSFAATCDIDFNILELLAFEQSLMQLHQQQTDHAYLHSEGIEPNRSKKYGFGLDTQRDKVGHLRWHANLRLPAYEIQLNFQFGNDQSYLPEIIQQMSAFRAAVMKTELARYLLE